QHLVVLRVMPYEPGRLREPPEVVCADIVLMDLGFAVARCADLDSGADVLPGVGLAQYIQVRRLDCLLERPARLDRETHRTTADRQARHALWRPRREEQTCRRANVGPNDVRSPQAPLIYQIGQESSQGLRRNQ